MWENEPFCQQTRQLHSIIEEELGPNSTQGFLQALASVAVHQLSIILQYDADCISVTYKASRNHQAATANSICNLSILEQTNWWMPQFTPKYKQDFCTMYSQTSPHGQQAAACKRLWNAWGTLNVMSDQRCYGAGAPKDPIPILGTITSQHYQIFQANLDMHRSLLEGDSSHDSEASESNVS